MELKRTLSQLPNCLVPLKHQYASTTRSPLVDLPTANLELVSSTPAIIYPLDLFVIQSLTTALSIFLTVYQRPSLPFFRTLLLPNIPTLQLKLHRKYRFFGGTQIWRFGVAKVYH
jgi:hypothetical protein